METISREEWERKEEHGYASIIEGQRYILKLVDGSGTCLVPVEVEKKGDEK